MSLVIDASVALKWVLDEPGQAEAEALLQESLIAPDWWIVEAASALARHVSRSNITSADAETRLARLSAAPVIGIPAKDVLGPALRLAALLDHPIYDCLYLALAIREETFVVTADRRFHAAVAGSDGLGQRVRLLLSPA